MYFLHVLAVNYTLAMHRIVHIVLLHCACWTNENAGTHISRSFPNIEKLISMTTKKKETNYVRNMLVYSVCV